MLSGQTAPRARPPQELPLPCCDHGPCALLRRLQTCSFLGLTQADRLRDAQNPAPQLSHLPGIRLHPNFTLNACPDPG